MRWRILAHLFMITVLARSIIAPSTKPKAQRTASSTSSTTKAKTTQQAPKKDVGSKSAIQHASDQTTLVLKNAKLGVQNLMENRPRFGKPDAYKDKIRSNRVKANNREIRKNEKAYSKNAAARATAQKPSSNPTE